VYTLFHLFAQLFTGLFSSLEQAFPHCTQPARYSVVLSNAADLTRSKADLLAENALLRQQLIILHRQVNKPSFSQSDHLWFVLLASRVRNWKQSLLILKPDTLSKDITRVRRTLPLYRKVAITPRGLRQVSP